MKWSRKLTYESFAYQHDFLDIRSLDNKDVLVAMISYV